MHDAHDAALADSPAAGADRPQRTWDAVKDAIRGTHHDYTEGPIGRAIFLLAVPMVLETVMESVFAVVDVFFVSRLGADAVATVGLTESMMVLVYSLAMGLGIGATATVARRIGERDADGAAHAAAQAILLGLIVSTVLGIVGVVLAPTLLRVMGGSPAVIANSSFMRVMLGGNATVLLLFLINAIFRGAGDAAIAMRVLWLANWINIVLGPLLIFGIGPFPELGVVGAAVATNIGRGTGALYAISRLFRSGARVHVQRRHFTFDPRLMWQMIRLSGSGTFQILIGTASWIGLIRVISSFGSAALAGYTIGIRVIIFALLPSWGLSNAAATMVGQALGAQKPERAERAVWIAARYNLVFLGTVGLLFVLLARAIVSLFTADPAVAPYAVDCLRIVALGFLFYAYGMVITSSFNGAGDTWTPTWLNLVVFWLWEIPLAYALAVVLEMGPRGVFVSITVAYSTLAVLSAWLFKKGRWKGKKV
ncbi:MAG TPA: MATE family efflux transporter [Gemmatimonadaceae bacterium]|nr:MATE family efflux transporter [Gemmatimonadaceae bacterium]